MKLKEPFSEKVLTEKAKKYQHIAENYDERKKRGTSHALDYVNGYKQCKEDVWEVLWEKIEGKMWMTTPEDTNPWIKKHNQCLNELRDELLALRGDDKK